MGIQTHLVTIVSYKRQPNRWQVQTYPANKRRHYHSVAVVISNQMTTSDTARVLYTASMVTILSQSQLSANRQSNQWHEQTTSQPIRVGTRWPCTSYKPAGVLDPANMGTDLLSGQSNHVVACTG